MASSPTINYFRHQNPSKTTETEKDSGAKKYSRKMEGKFFVLKRLRAAVIRRPGSTLHARRQPRKHRSVGATPNRFRSELPTLGLGCVGHANYSDWSAACS